MNTRRTPNASRWLLLSGLIVIADQLSKWVIVQSFDLYDSVTVNVILNIQRLHNFGAAFSFLGDQDGWQRWFFIILALVVCVVITVWLFKLPARGQWLLVSALALVLGGAIGNVIDRIRFGYVVDFIQVHWRDAYFPTFNVADIAISIGAGLLILDALLSREPVAVEPVSEEDAATDQDKPVES
ncbi:MAG: signal peptidase II [Pseudomonadota bacterium]